MGADPPKVLDAHLVFTGRSEQATLPELKMLLRVYLAEARKRVDIPVLKGYLCGGAYGTWGKC